VGVRGVISDFPHRCAPEGRHGYPGDTGTACHASFEL
jgi:hypothetical protein